ncbi:hypothetical protein D9M71_754560 [compost metagenome]
MADPEQRSPAIVHVLNGCCQIAKAPVQVGHLETFQGCGPGLSDTSVIDSQDVEALFTGMLGEAAVETLLHTRRTRHDEVALQWPLCGITDSGQAIAIVSHQC